MVIAYRIVPSIGQNLQPFMTSPYEWKILEWDENPQKKQTNKLTFQIIIQTTMRFFQHYKIVEIKSIFLFWLMQWIFDFHHFLNMNKLTEHSQNLSGDK